MVKLKLVEEEDGELVDKGPEIIKALAQRLAHLSPEAAQIYDLLKAKVQKEKDLKYPALQKLAQAGKTIFDKQMQLMLEEINKVLDESVKTQKSIEAETSEPQQMSPDVAFLFEHDDLSKKAEAVRKASQDPYNPNVDHTKKIADKDMALYQRVRGQIKLKFKDVTDADFDKPGGRYYGWSVNALVDILEGKQ